MRRLALVSTVLLLAAPRTAEAVDLLLGWDALGAWTSNVFRVPEDEEDDFSIYAGPNVGLQKQQGDLRFDVHYRPRYEAFLETGDANTFEHFAEGSASWSVTRRTELTLGNRFSRTRGLRQVFEDGGADDPEAGEVFVDRQVTLRNAASGGVTHFLSPRLQLAMNFNQQLYEFQDEDRSDSSSWRGSANLRRILTPRQTIGMGVAATRQDFQETTFREESGTTFVEVFGIYDLTISRAWSLAFSGGPSWVFPDDFESERVVREYAVAAASSSRGLLLDRSSCTGDEQNTCAVPASLVLAGTPIPVPPQLVAIGSIPTVSVPFQDGAPTADTSLTFFGTMALNYNRRPYRLSLSYTRRASTSSGLGASTNLDVAAAQGIWEPSRRWRFSLSSSWQRQVSTSELPVVAGLLSSTGSTVLLDSSFRVVTDPADAVFEALDVAGFDAVRTVDLVDNAIDISSYRATFRVDHKLTRRLDLRGSATYWYQKSEGELTSGSSRDSLRFELGFRWSFDPIAL